jgi:hypothetical protein
MGIHFWVPTRIVQQTCVFMCVFVCVSVHASMCMCVRVRVHMCISACMHPCMCACVCFRRTKCLAGSKVGQAGQSVNGESHSWMATFCQERGEDKNMSL